MDLSGADFFKRHGLLSSLGNTLEEKTILLYCRSHCDIAGKMRERLSLGASSMSTKSKKEFRSSWHTFQLCNNRGLSTKPRTCAMPGSLSTVYPRLPDDVLWKIRKFLSIGNQVPTLVFTTPGSGGGSRIIYVDVGAQLMRQEIELSGRITSRKATVNTG